MTGCYAKGCKNASINKVKMNFFPKDPKRRSIWIKNCKKFGASNYSLPNEHSALCEYHFAANMWEKARVDGTKKLKSNAEPTIFGDLVVQINEKVKDIPVKAGYLKAITVCTDPNTKSIQILTQPDKEYNMILVNGRIKLDKNRSISKSPQEPSMKKSKQLSPITNKNLSILLNNNVQSHLTDDAPSKVITKPINDNINYSNIGKTRHEITNDNHLTDNGGLQVEDSDTDSFINENFEPITDEEIDSNEEDNKNFEPLTDEEVDDNEGDDVQIEAKYNQNYMTAIESRLHSLQTKLKNTSNNDFKCNICERIEKVYLKSEETRIVMKKNYMQVYKRLNRTIRLLENKIQILEENQIGLHKLLNKDQINFLSRKQKKIYRWSENTLERAKQYKHAFGTEGYKLLLDHNWPLPSLRTLRLKQKVKKKSGNRQ